MNKGNTKCWLPFTKLVKGPVDFEHQARTQIGIFLPKSLSRASGTTVRARSILACLEPHFHVTAVGRGRNDSESNWLIVRVPEREREMFRDLIQVPFWLFGITRILLRHKFDLVYSCNDWLGLPICLTMRAFNRRVVYEAHGILSEETKAWGKPSFLVWVLRCWEAIMLKRCDLIIALSGHIVKFYQRYARRIELIPVFVDTNVYRRKESAGQELRERFGWRGKRVVGLIGPFDYNRWNDSALEYLEENLEKFDERIIFAVIGKCKSRKLDRCVYTGFVDDFPAMLSSLDAVLVARRLPTSGPLNKIVESMSCSLPVFTTPEGMVGMDYAKNGKDIIVATESNMTATLNSLLFNDDLMRTIGQEARQTVENNYSYEANASKVTRILDSLSH